MAKKNKSKAKVVNETIEPKKVEKEEIEVVEVKQRKRNVGRKNIFLYFFMMLGIFAVIDFAMMLISSDLSSLAAYHRYGDDIVLEIFYAVLVLVVMLLFKNSYVFTNKQEKLWKSILMASPILLFSGIVLVTNITSLKLNSPESINFNNIISLLIFCALIGITEEFLCRGWLQNEFLERYGDTKRNVITSIIFASFIFGVMHLSNIFATSQHIFETLLQIINAMSLGFLFGVLYYKTKNIWSVIVLHAIYDFSIMVGDLSTLKECTYGTATTNIIAASSFSTLMLSAFWILSALLILKRCNFPDKKANMSKLRDFYLLVIPMLVFTFVFSMIPYENLIEDYSDYYTCYNYNELEMKENYTLHSPMFDKYTIKYDSSVSSFVLDEDEVEEVVTVGKFNFELFTKNQMPVLKNVNTGSEVKLSDNITYDFKLIENKDTYTIILVTMDKEKEERIYISTYMTKENLSNSDTYLNNVVESFREIALPPIDAVGYITIEGKEGNYPAFQSSDHDVFAIIDDELFVLKR